jgi:hypothetical protein
MPKVGTNWTCPYCGHAQVISESRHSAVRHKVWIEGWKEGKPLLTVEAIACANNDCLKLSLKEWLATYEDLNDGRYRTGPTLNTWQLLPASSAKPQPDFIPQPLRDDYNEACAIRDLSPKASATLIRRCLQGMIRNFCGIPNKKSLYDEIEELGERIENGQAPLGVQPDHIKAIHRVREIGNIGAHMERDIDLIIDVDPNEAQTLIELAEVLFDEWYLARNVRQARLASIATIATKKEAMKGKPKKPPQLEGSKG